MMTTQWYDIVGIIGGIFAGFSTLLVVVVRLEQWLARPDPSTLASADEQGLDEPARGGIKNWAPDLSVQAGGSHPPRTAAPGLRLDPSAVRAIGRLFTVLPPRTGQRRP